jgi:transposase
VSADAADWIADVVAERCPAAIRCADPFHVVAWATEALDAHARHFAGRENEIMSLWDSPR